MRKQVVFLLAAPFLFLLAYLVGLFWLARIYHQPWSLVVPFPPEPLGARGGLAVFSQGITLLGTMGLIGLVPGVPLVLAFAPSRWSRLTILVAGGLVNFGLMMGITTILKLIGFFPLTRAPFLVSWGFCLLAGVLIGFQKRCVLTEAVQRLWPTPYHWRVVLLAGLLALLVGLVAYPKLVIENFNGDGTEIFAPAESLRVHLLPYWDLEVEPHFGLPVSVPLWSHHYLMLPWLLFLGPSEAAVRLPLLGYLFLLFIAMFALIQDEDPTPLPGWFLAFLALSTLYVTLLFVYYGGYDHYIADSAYGASCLFLGLLTVLQLYCLKKKRGCALILLISLGISARYWILPVSLGLLGAMWWSVPHLRTWVSRLLSTLSILLGLAALVTLLIGWQEGILRLWAKHLTEEYSSLWSWKSLRELPRHMFRWMILGGIIPFGSFYFTRRLSSTGKILALTTVMYGGLLAFLPQDRTFYDRTVLGLLTLLTGGFWFNQLSRKRRDLLGSIASTILVILCFFVFPRSFNVSTANREFGKKTCMLFSSYEEAMAHSRIAATLFERGLMGWYIDYPAWVHYATIAERPTRPYLYYLTSRPAPPMPNAVLVLADKQGSFFFAATREAAQALRDWAPPLRPHLRWLRDSG